MDIPQVERAVAVHFALAAKAYSAVGQAASALHARGGTVQQSLGACLALPNLSPLAHLEGSTWLRDSVRSATSEIQWRS